MLTKCYAVYSQFPLVLPYYEIKGVYRFTSDKKTAKRAVKHLKKQGMRKADYAEINPNNWAVLIEFPQSTALIAKGFKSHEEAEEVAVLFKGVFQGLPVFIQQFKNTELYQLSFSKEGFYA